MMTQIVEVDQTKIKKRIGGEEMKGKLGLMGKNHSDELYTPDEAFDILNCVD
jgi:hypothetical protein